VTEASGGSSRGPSLYLIAPRTSSPPSTSPISCMSQTLQRPGKRWSLPQWQEGWAEETPDHPVEGTLHQLEHKEHQREK
jgi:hypothetical protein